MTIQIIGEANKDRLYCAGSMSKLLTTFTTLSFLAEQYDLDRIIDDDSFLDSLPHTAESRAFLTLFQGYVGGRFTIHDLCSFYSGLPYTFDVSSEEIEIVDSGNPYKHHSIPDEKTFLYRCQNLITPVYRNRCKFHYSEIAIIFLGYLMEKVYQIPYEERYADYVINKFHLKNSHFSRTRVPSVFIQDLSEYYDLGSIAIVDHGYFCYSNGFYTTLNDEKTLLENLIDDPVFQFMTDIKRARAASNRLLNGLAVELRVHNDDIVIGYDGLSFSGCNLWAYSTQQKKGYLTFNENGDLADKTIFDHIGYTEYDTVPEHTETWYREFIKHYDFSNEKNIAIPEDFQGNYHRVKINDFDLKHNFPVTAHTVDIRDTDDIIYEVVNVDEIYRILCKDRVHGGKIGLYTAKSGNKYLSFGGVLLKK